MINPFKSLLFTMTDHDVRYVVGGGVAAVLHGVERVTMDLDIALDMTPDNLDRFIACVTSLGLKPRIPMPIEALKDPKSIEFMIESKNAIVFSLVNPDEPIYCLDVFLEPGLSYTELVRDSITLSIETRKIQVVSIRKLLELKKSIKPPRDKDALDINALERILEKS
jgi:hypothetical protein